ncbi:hypothetical protein E2C01_087575 [Portunus trituberculatus]|uniref:Uncharacterized protein n=1 Tax=Portunus trituberculatus TaxID=210409 RepID=A0A5B7JJN8_PORTR|nr:hypothetical protein [Portunus trituberculatus]
MFFPGFLHGCLPLPTFLPFFLFLRSSLPYIHSTSTCFLVFLLDSAPVRFPYLPSLPRSFLPSLHPTLHFLGRSFPTTKLGSFPVFRASTVANSLFLWPYLKLISRSIDERNESRFSQGQ